MLLIRISGKEYTFSREAWDALIGATRARRYCTCDIASMYPSMFKTEISDVPVEVSDEYVL